MAAIDDLRSAVGDLQAAAQAEHEELGSVVGELSTVEQQLAGLQGQVASGGSVSEADLEQVTQSVTALAQSAQAAVESAKSATGTAGGSAPAGPAPSPGPTPAPPAPTTPAPTSPLPPGGAPSPEPPAPSAPGPAPTGERTVYVFDGDPSTVDTSVWPSAGAETLEASPRPVFFYSGDANPGDSNGDGVGGLWHVYTGPTQPVGGTGTASGTGEAELADQGGEA